MDQPRTSHTTNAYLYGQKAVYGQPRSSCRLDLLHVCEGVFVCSKADTRLVTWKPDKYCEPSGSNPRHRHESSMLPSMKLPCETGCRVSDRCRAQVDLPDGELAIL